MEIGMDEVLIEKMKIKNLDLEIVIKYVLEKK